MEEQCHLKRSHFVQIFNRKSLLKDGTHRAHLFSLRIVKAEENALNKFNRQLHKQQAINRE